MFSIKVVGRVRPCEPEPPQEQPEDWRPRRWAGAPIEWHAGFVSVVDLGGFSIEAGESPWEAARTAFDWRPEHGFDRVDVSEFVDGDRLGRALIGHREGASMVFIVPSDVTVYLLGENGQTVDRI